VLRRTRLKTFFIIALLGSGLSTAALARGGGVGGGHFGGGDISELATCLPLHAPGIGAAYVNRRDRLGHRRHGLEFSNGDYCDLPYYQGTDPWPRGVLQQ
jgi:hypothetical protein